MSRNTPAQIFKQGNPPDQSNAVTPDNPIPWVGDLWIDVVNVQLKQCTSINPYIWAAIGGGAGPSFADAETPSGLINGVNTTFTLAHTPNPGASLQLYYATGAGNALLLLLGGSDYTLSTNTITTGFTPATGGVLLAYYRF